jgi:hypothetical protein
MRAGKQKRWLIVGGGFGAGIAVGVSALTVFVGSGVAASSAKPVNATPPTISGMAEEGKTLTATQGTWNSNPVDYDYNWRRCASDGFSCMNIIGATNLTYTLKSVDVGNTLRFRVVAKNADGQTAAQSAPTAVVQKAPVTTTTTATTTVTTTTTTPTPINHKPSIRILSVRFVGLRVYARMRVCDDSHRRLNIIERDSRGGVPSYTRRFRTLTAPSPCSTLTRNWLPAPRFRHQLTITVWARDFAGLTSRPASRSFSR